MKRGVFFITGIAVVLVLAAALVLRLHENSAHKSVQHLALHSTPGISPPAKGTVPVNDKMDTSGNCPPVIFSRDGNLYAVRLDGSAPVLLTNTGYNRVTYYLPQEGKLLFIRSKRAGDVTGDVMGVDFTTGRQTMLLPASLLGSPGFYGFVDAALSPGGKKLIAAEGNEAAGGGGPLYSASPDGQNFSSPITPNIGAGWFAFNPDGTGLAVENFHTDVRATLIYNLVWNKNLVPMIKSADNDYNALWAGDFAWRPDGRSITFMGYTFNGARGPKNGIYEVTTGGSVTPLYPASGKWIDSLHWLSATRLAFIAMPYTWSSGNTGPDPAGTADFYVLDVASGKLSLLMYLKYEEGQPQWSWNPGRTAFVFQKRWQGCLWVKDLASGETYRIPGTEGTDLNCFTWGSDPFAGRH